MNDLCIVINTCKHYYDKTIKDLISQINEYKYPKQNILIISAQEDVEETFYEDNIQVIKVKYTGLHLTSMIYINEHIGLYPHIKYWLFLPDTIKFGPNFYSLLTKYYTMYLQKGEILCLSFINICPYSYDNTLMISKNIPLLTELYLQEKDLRFLSHIINPFIFFNQYISSHQTMDMGILHSNHIVNLTSYLQKIKTYDISIENLIRLKKQLILDENTTLGIPPICNKDRELYIIHPDLIRFISNHHEDLENTKIEDGKIHQVYFVLLDLYKFQRNFNGTEGNIILSL
jgi:hypothetical protein